MPGKFHTPELVLVAALLFAECIQVVKPPNFASPSFVASNNHSGNVATVAVRLRFHYQGCHLAM